MSYLLSKRTKYVDDTAITLNDTFKDERSARVAFEKASKELEYKGLPKNGTYQEVTLFKKQSKGIFNRLEEVNSSNS